MGNDACRVLDQWIERYHQRLALLNHSPRTWPTTRGVLAQFGRFLAERKIGDVATLSPELLRDYQGWLYHQPTRMGRSRSAAGRNRCLRVVRGLCRFLHEEGMWPRDPAQGIHYAREPHLLPRNVLTQQEARQIVEIPDLGTLVGYRDRVILEVLYGTGIRKSELQNLRPGDVDLGEGLLRINGGKGAKDRVVPLTGVAARFLDSYIGGVRARLLAGRTSDRLFISQRGRPIARNTLDHLMEKYARLSNVGKHLTCHLWRHTCATHLIQNRANLRHVQELLGHRSLATTERYLHLTIAELKAAHARYHPRDRQTAVPRNLPVAAKPGNLTP